MLTLAIVALLAGTVSPLFASAKTVDEIKQEENTVTEQGVTLNSEIQVALDEVNQKYRDLEKLKQDVTQAESTITTTQEKIKKTQDSIKKRTRTMVERMQDAQIKGTQDQSLQMLLDSESLSDFLNRVYAYTTIQTAENSKVESLYNDKEKLATMKDKLSTTKKTLVEKQATAEKQAADLDTKVASLQTELKNNQVQLEQLSSDRKSEEEKAAKEAQAAKDKQAAAEKAQKETVASSSETSSSSSTTDTTENTSTPDNNSNNNQGNDTDDNNNNSGTSKNGEATAYVATGHNTASGTVPTPGRTIAVDRSVIPLGSLVKIVVPSAPQYSGYYVAEDTGGAVSGNIIDIFVGSNAEATSFGRRAITFSIGN